MISDAMFFQTRINQLERHAKRGFMSRVKAEGLKAFVKVLPTHVRFALFLLSLLYLDSNFLTTPPPPSLLKFVASHIRDYLSQKDTLLSFSKQTALDVADLPEMIDLLLQRDDWTYLKVRQSPPLSLLSLLHRSI